MLHRSTPIGNMQGRAIYQETPSDHSLLYREKGWLRTSFNQEIAFFRDYFYIFQEDTIHLWFVEQQWPSRFFHSLAFDSDDCKRARGRHQCGKDFYDASFYFDEGRIEFAYQVLGPSKDFTIHTILTKGLENFVV